MFSAGCGQSRTESPVSDSSAGTDVYDASEFPKHTLPESEKPVYDSYATCSIYIYMCGSNLESKNGLAGKDIDELLEAEIPEQVNVVLETGGAAKWHSHGIAKNKLQRYLIKNHSLVLVEEQENQSMGAESTFVDFLRWGKSSYPAKRNLLVSWDHGGDATKGVCYDENYGFHGLKQSDFDEALANGHTDSKETFPKYDLVIFDTCLMGNIETAAWLQDYAHYMIASEVIIPGGGLDYRVIAGEFAGNDNETFGKRVCDSFMEQYKEKDSAEDVELSLFDLSRTDELLSSLEFLYADQIARIQAEEPKDALAESEVTRNLCHGVSLYFPLLFDKSELKDYINICPIEKYAEFLDLLYLHIPDVPLAFANAGSINADGQFEMQLTEESAEYLKEVSIKVWKQRPHENKFFMIGSQTISFSDIRDLTFTAPFNGEWYYLNGRRLTAAAVRKGRRNELTAPILVDGEEKSYAFTIFYLLNGSPAIQRGKVGLHHDEHGLVERLHLFRRLRRGDVVEVLSEDPEEETEAFTVESRLLKAEIGKLEPGIYRLQFLAVDIQNNYISSDYALYQVSADETWPLGIRSIL